MKREMTTLLTAAILASPSIGQEANAQAPAMKLTGDGVKIGVLTDMSGLYADLGGPNSVIAVQMAIDDFKAQFKPSYRIEVVGADHLNKPDTGAAKAREWYDRDGVDMITDVLQSAVALAVAKVGAEKKRIMMNTGAATTRLTNEDCSPYTVHYVYDTYALANGTARAVTKQGGDTWYFLTADYAFGHSLEKDTSEMVKEAGGKILGAVRHPLNTQDFSSFLLQAQASKAKIVGLANAGGDAVNAVKAASEFGLTRNQTVAPLLLTIQDVHALGLPAAQGMVFTDGFYWDLNDETRAWSRRFFDRTKKMPTMLHAGNYSATLAYLKAVHAAGTDDADPVMQKLKETTINDMFAVNGRIREDGRMVHDMYVVQVKKPAESTAAWDYYHVKAVVPADEAFQPLSQSRCTLVKK